MKTKLELTIEVRATPEEIFNTWLNSEGHSSMTESEAVIEPVLGFEFSAWDGYITGRNLELIPNQKIVQSWRTTDFDDTDEDSLLTIHLASKGDGTEFTLIHSKIPENQPNYKQGWNEYYFEPMTAYFNSL